MISAAQTACLGVAGAPPISPTREVLPSTLTMTTAPRTLHNHLVWPNYHTWSIELLPRSCALAARDRVLRRWTTSLYVKLLLPPRQSYGIHRFDSVIDIFCALRQESVGKIL